jgi:hypothetical protein
MTNNIERDLSHFKDMLFIARNNLNVCCVPFIPKSSIYPRNNTAHYKTYPLHYKKL